MGEEINEVIVTIKKNPAGWTITIAKRAPQNKGYYRSSRYRGLVMCELLDVLVTELSALDPAQMELDY